MNLGVQTDSNVTHKVSDLLKMILSYWLWNYFYYLFAILHDYVIHMQVVVCLYAQGLDGSLHGKVSVSSVDTNEIT